MPRKKEVYDLRGKVDQLANISYALRQASTLIREVTDSGHISDVEIAAKLRKARQKCNQCATFIDNALEPTPANVLNKSLGAGTPEDPEDIGMDPDTGEPIDDTKEATAADEGSKSNKS